MDILDRVRHRFVKLLKDWSNSHPSEVKRAGLFSFKEPRLRGDQMNVSKHLIQVKTVESDPSQWFLVTGQPVFSAVVLD